jgi:hypothetical protein
MLWLISPYVWSFLARFEWDHAWDLPHLSLPEVIPVWLRIALAGFWTVATFRRFEEHKRWRIA